MNTSSCSDINDYRPFRRGTLTDEQLRECGHLRPAIAVRDTLALWAQILAVLLLAWHFDHWLAYLAAIPLVGTRYYALFIIGHDGLHRRLFADKRANDLWNDLFILGPIGAITRLNRENHMLHHRSMGLAIDPDRHKYIRKVPRAAAGLMLDLLGVPYVMRAVRNVFVPRQASTGPKAGYSLRDIAILAGWQVALFAFFASTIGWWAYFVLWWIPVYVFAFCADVTRVFFEHAEFEPESGRPGHRLVTYLPAWYERMLLSPMNMNHHVAHHLWPAIPYYNLPRATALLRQTAPASGLAWRDSYFRQLSAVRGQDSI